MLSLDDTLTASDVCHLSATCTAARRAAAETPAFWASLDLSLLPHPTAFFTDSISQAARFHGVRALTLRFCDTLRDAHLALLPPSLTALTLDACHAITDAGMKALTITCAKRLQLLSLYWNHHVGNASCLALSLRCPSLTSLSFSGCKQLGATGVLSLASRCKRLTTLNLTRCKGVDDLALATLVQVNPQLRVLLVYAAAQYTDVPIVALAQHCRMMTTMDCTGLAHLTDAALLALANGCPHLSTLILTWVIELTDAGVIPVVRSCPLHTLSLHGLQGIGEPSFSALVECRAASLTAVDVRGCTGLETRTPEALVRVLPRLRRFVLAT